MKQLTISLADHIYDQLLTYCKKTGQKHTAVIRQAIFEFLINMVPFTVLKCNDNDENK